jgi:hypothetical protein
LFISESVILLVDSLYAEAIEAVKSRAALSASTPELISILASLPEQRRAFYVHKQRPEPADVRPHAGLGASDNRVTSLTARRGGSVNT